MFWVLQWRYCPVLLSPRSAYKSITTAICFSFRGLLLCLNTHDYPVSRLLFAIPNTGDINSSTSLPISPSRLPIAVWSRSRARGMDMPKKYHLEPRLGRGTSNRRSPRRMAGLRSLVEFGSCRQQHRGFTAARVRECGEWSPCRIGALVRRCHPLPGPGPTVDPGQPAEAVRNARGALLP